MTPPATPLEAGGEASSLISASFLGMNFGANSWPFAKNDFGTRGMTWTAAGGGGGGATSSVFSNCGILA
jgi:hypothetical protein